ncbi:hypothetical protein Ahy_B02g058802 [Arachis hypogaea]|uniref:MULE transposase domain-containing protein n=1 Tax=Arachis hypogaea TaxID=3818 RepID=A0A445AFH1_ARAHY|nr:hypothetical protein Ahy_B02g058802 [Arachis hypogaea]
MTEADIMQMMNMLKSRISTSQKFGLLASQVGGYEFVGYGPREMYNEIARQRRQVPGLLRNLFWSDGISQLDYQLFGDIIAFDTTYKKNKYSCPLVIFSGVNHHNQTIVFAAVLIVEETTDTYIWLVRQLMFAMKGKTPTSIITDGAMVIRNAVRDIFSEVRHRLCAWHFIRNATSNIGNPSFTSKFRKIMLGDYEISVFKRKWVQLIEEFDLEDKPWVKNMYEEKHIWATAYKRGKFFDGLELPQDVKVYNQLWQEFNANYESIHGVPVMQTCIELLERFAIETKKVKSALNDASGFTRDAVVISHQSALMEFFKQLAVVATKVLERFEETHDIIMGLYFILQDCRRNTMQPQSGVAKSRNPYVHQTNIGSRQPSKNKRQHCSVCQMEGYKKTTCSWQKNIDNNVMEDEANNGSDNSDINPNSLQRHSSSSTHSLLPISFELVVPLNASSLIPSLPFSCRISPTASQVGPSKLTPSLLLVQLTILQWKHSSRARLLPPSRCSVPPSPAPSLFHRGLVWRYLFTKPIAAFKVTRSLAAKAFQTSLPLCRETFFSATMEDHIVKRYQELIKESSRLPLFDLRKLNSSLPIPSAPNCPVDVLVLGAKNDFIVDAEGLNETAKFYSVLPDCVDAVAHDMMLDVSWEK